MVKQSKQLTPTLIVILLISLAITYWSQQSHLWDRYRVIEDVQNFYRMARFQDPDLFPVDYLGGFRLIEISIFGQSILLMPLSLGYGLFFYIETIAKHPNFVIPTLQPIFESGPYALYECNESILDTTQKK